MDEIQTLLESEQFRVSEITYEANNGVSVKYQPSNVDDEDAVRILGCSWPAEWSDKRMEGATLSDDELEARKAEALREAHDAVENALHDEN